MLALDKPAGLAVHGGSGISFGAIERLRLARPAAAFLELVHRLDRDTSGVLLVAKKRSALTALHAQLRDGAIDKRYLVLVRGKWRDALRAVDLPLTSYVTGDGERRVRVDAAGPARADDVSAREAHGRTPIRRSRCSKPSSRRAARTRSACTCRTSAFRSPATTSTAISRGTRRSRGKG